MRVSARAPRQTRRALKALVKAGCLAKAGDEFELTSLGLGENLPDGALVNLLDQVDSYNTCVVEWVPVRSPYLKKAIKIERPRWELVQVSNGKEEAVNYQPCVFIDFEREGEAYRAMAYTLGDPPSSPDRR